MLNFITLGGEILEKLQHSKMEKLSILMTIISCFYLIKDIIFPVDLTATVQKRLIPIQIEMGIMFIVFSCGLIFGVIAMFQRNSKKIGPTIAIIINGWQVIPLWIILIKIIFLHFRFYPV